MRSFYFIAVSHESAPIKWLVPERARELDTTEGVRDLATVSLSPAMPKPVPVIEGRDKHSFLPNWSSPRRCLQMQKNVRGGIEFFDIGSSSPQGAMGRQFERTASTQVHRSWRARIAAPRLALIDSISANCIGSRALLPATLMHETVRTRDHSCGPHLRI